MALTGQGKGDPGPAANSLNSSPNPDQAAESSGPELSEDHEGTRPEQEARQEYEGRIRGLLRAYQQTLDTVEELPAGIRV